MKIITLTCARLKSTRMHHKCLQLLAGKPLIHHTIEFAKKLPYPHYVFTRDDEIRNASYDCNIIDEPEELYDVPGNIHDKLCYINKTVKADYIVLLQATSPFRSNVLMMHWINDFVNSSFSAGWTVYPVNREMYQMTGSFFIISKEILTKEYNDITVDNSKMYIDFQNIDIDTEEDMKRARAFYDVRG